MNKNDIEKKEMINTIALAEERRQFILNGVELGYIQLPVFEEDHANKIYQRCLNESPSSAIAAMRAEAKAEALDEMAATYRGYAKEDDCSCNMKSSYNLTAERAENYAAYVRRQLRESKGAQK